MILFGLMINVLCCVRLFCLRILKFCEIRCEGLLIIGYVIVLMIFELLCYVLWIKWVLVEIE